MTNIISIQNGEALTTSLVIADGVGNPHSTIIKLIRTYLADLEEFGPIRFEIQKGNPLPQGGFARSSEIALLNENQTSLLMTYMRNSEVVRGFKKRLIKAFSDLKKEIAPRNYIQALRELADSEERKLIAEQQRDEAVRTKAEIGHRREATAMNTASQATKRANKLADKMGEGNNYKQVKSIDWLSEYFNLNKVAYQQIGKQLNKICKEMSLSSIETPSSEYGSVKSYPIEAICKFKTVLDSDSCVLAKYRKDKVA